MQRLFSTFANSWPGLGLLIQRLAIGLALLHDGTLQLQTQQASLTVLAFAEGIVGALMLMGLWTPIAGALVVVTELSIIFFGTSDLITPAMMAVLGGTLAMIGPGAWSIDARLFGRKHIVG